MGQKVNPTGFRLGTTEKWRSMWFAEDKDYAQIVESDMQIRRYLEKRLSNAALSRVAIERAGDKVSVRIYTARPGVVIGKKGSEIDVIRQDLQNMTGSKVSADVIEVKRPELDAILVAKNVAEQLEGRVAFRRAMKQAVQDARKSGAEGIRIQCSGRLGGAEMSRREWYHEGRVPLHTMRAKIDYGFAEASTQMGTCGIKVWIYHGEKLPGQPAPEPALEGPSGRGRGRGGRGGRRR